LQIKTQTQSIEDVGNSSTLNNKIKDTKIADQGSRIE